MIPHLHLHLEPEERKRRALGMLGRRPTSASAFFEAHRVDGADRVSVSESDLREFLREVHAEQRAQGVGYVELRLSPRRFLVDGLSLRAFLDTTHKVLQNMTEPEIKAVLLVNRDCPEALLEDYGEEIDRLPSTFVGVDLAGDERRHPDVTRFVPFFSAARAEGLGTSVHAGEFGTPEHVWSAVDELGAQRIGHGVAAASSAALLTRLSRDVIHVEVSLTSNEALGAVQHLDEHPVRAMLDRGVPVSFNADVPLHTGRSFTDEISEARMLLGARTEDILSLQREAMAFRFTPPARSRA